MRHLSMPAGCMRACTSVALVCTGSQWTSLKRLGGWRHYRVIEKRNEPGGPTAHLCSVCDSDVRFWVRLVLLLCVASQALQLCVGSSSAAVSGLLSTLTAWVSHFDHSCWCSCY